MCQEPPKGIVSPHMQQNPVRQQCLCQEEGFFGQLPFALASCPPAALRCVDREDSHAGIDDNARPGVSAEICRVAIYHAHDFSGNTRSRTPSVCGGGLCEENANEGQMKQCSHLALVTISLPNMVGERG